MLSLGLLKPFLELRILVAEILNGRLGLFSVRSLDTELGLKCSNAALIVRIITSKLLLAGSEGFLRFARCVYESAILSKL